MDTASEIMLAYLNHKNQFVVDLREHLKSKYGTKRDYTFGEGNYEAKKIGNGYHLVRRGFDKQRDISGFCLRKDLCSFPPQNEDRILQEVHDFALTQQKIESILEKHDALGKSRKRLTISFWGQKYLVLANISEGYAGEIDVYFMELPDF